MNIPPSSDNDQPAEHTPAAASEQAEDAQKTSKSTYKDYVLKHRSKGWWILALFLCLIAIILFWRFFASRGAVHPAVKPVLVVVATAQTKNVPVYVPALGSVTPTFTVTIRTQVNGRLLRVLYREGQNVKAGDLLAEIDPRPFQAQLIQFQGDLKRDQALLDNARLDLKRFYELYPVGAVSQQTLDTQIALVKQDEGAVQVDQGLIDGAQVNLVYCRIISPINGRVGLRLVDPGNFVQTTDPTGLVVVNTINPITVIFPIPEDNVPEVLQQMHTHTLVAEAYDRWQHKLLSIGKLITIDNQIDPTTGTVKLKALFPNQYDKLFPNQFVNVQLKVDTLRNATIVPTAAIQHGVDGPFVYRLNKNLTVSVQPVTVSVVWGDYTTINTGILPGQQVVTEGADKLRDGSPVKLYGQAQIYSSISLLLEEMPRRSHVDAERRSGEV
jgi:multidrug efflux system membrane fusion protein